MSYPVGRRAAHPVRKMPIRKTAWDNLFNFIPEFPFLKIENEAQGRQAISIIHKTRLSANSF
jgi:hypothetical protein